MRIKTLCGLFLEIEWIHASMRKLVVLLHLLSQASNSMPVANLRSLLQQEQSIPEKIRFRVILQKDEEGIGGFILFRTHDIDSDVGVGG